MQDWQSYAAKHGILLYETGPCQFCGAAVSSGVAECHQNVHHIAELLDYNDAANYTTRFLSVDALALQHCELHGPWNNYIHFARLVLIFEKNVEWNYKLTPLLSNVVNDFKRNRNEFRTPPPALHRGKLTTQHVLNTDKPEGCRVAVKEWAFSVYEAFYNYRGDVDLIVSRFITKR